MSASISTRVGKSELHKWALVIALNQIRTPLLKMESSFGVLILKVANLLKNLTNVEREVSKNLTFGKGCILLGETNPPVVPYLRETSWRSSDHCMTPSRSIFEGILCGQCVCRGYLRVCE